MARAGSHLELEIIRSIGGMLRLANGGDTLVDAGSAGVPLLGGWSPGTWRTSSPISRTNGASLSDDV
jgi:hypothetical protein